VGPRAGLDVCEKSRLHRDFFFSGDSIPGSSSPSLYRLSYPAHSQVLETMRIVVQMARFYRSNTGIVGSNPTWDSDICVSVLRVVLRKQ
jgi:hypothetical protein